MEAIRFFFYNSDSLNLITHKLKNFVLILICVVLILQVLVRLVGADDHVYPNFIDVMQWLAESNLLEMIVDKLSPSVSENQQMN